MRRHSARSLRIPDAPRGPVAPPFSFPGRGDLGLDHPLHSVSPLVQGIQPQNLRFPRDGGIAVALWDRWPAMIAGLQLLKRVLVVTGNPASAIGHYRDYPGLAYCRGGARFAHGAGMAVDLRQWSRARATETRHGGSLRYAIEFCDERNEPIHRICLAADSEFPEFLEWVRTHQAVGIPPMPAPPRRDGLLGRRPAGRRKALLPLLHRLMELEVPIRVAVGNVAVSQSHAFAIREMREAGEWLYCAGEEAGWHLAPSRVHLLRKETCACCGGYWLRGLDAEGTTLFILSPAPETDLILWNGLAVHAAGIDI